MIWVTQLLPLAVGKGGKVPLREPVGALKVLEEDGAVPVERVPERGPLGALNGVEPVGAGNPDEGRVPDRGPLGALNGTEPVGAEKLEEEGNEPDREPRELVKGTEPVENGKPDDGDILPDRGPLGALNGTEPEGNGKPDDGREPLAPDVKKDDAPELRTIVDESGPPEREPRELVNGGKLAVVSTGNDSV